MDEGDILGFYHAQLYRLVRSYIVYQDNITISFAYLLSICIVFWAQQCRCPEDRDVQPSSKEVHQTIAIAMRECGVLGRPIYSSSSSASVECVRYINIALVGNSRRWRF